MLLLLLLLACQGITALNYGKFSSRLASCNGEAVMRACYLDNGLATSACESGDECTLMYTREYQLEEPPVSESESDVYVFSETVGLCESPCRVDSDCWARFGPRSSCVQDGNAAGLIFEGAFCVELTDGPEFDCDDGNAGTVDLAVEMDASKQLPNPSNTTSSPVMSVLNALTPCSDPGSETCACIHYCTPLNSRGCGASQSVTQYAYLAPGSSGENLMSPNGSERHCPNAAHRNNTLLCSFACDEDGVCPDPEEEPGCGTFWVTNATLLVDAETLLVNTNLLACFNCTTDADCQSGRSNTLEFCYHPPETELPEFVSTNLDLYPASGYCVALCQTEEMNEAIAAPRCYGKRIGFVCSHDQDCLGGDGDEESDLFCSPRFNVCAPRGPGGEPECTNSAECADWMNLATDGLTPVEFGAVCVNGTCALACKNDTSACEAYYDALNTPVDHAMCISISHDDDDVQHICALRCDRRSASSSTPIALIVGLSVLGALLCFGVGVPALRYLSPSSSTETKTTTTTTDMKRPYVGSRVPYAFASQNAHYYEQMK